MDTWLPYIRIVSLLWFAGMCVLIYRAVRSGMGETAHLKITDNPASPAAAAKFGSAPYRS